MSEETQQKENALILNYPVKLGTLDKVSVLNFRRIKGRDIRKMNVSDPSMNDLLELAEKLTNQTTAFFDEMDGTDIINVVEKVGKFLESSQATGSSR